MYPDIWSFDQSHNIRLFLPDMMSDLDQLSYKSRVLFPDMSPICWTISSYQLFYHFTRAFLLLHFLQLMLITYV